VPPTNGFSPGVNQTLRGQPPPPVVAAPAVLVAATNPLRVEADSLRKQGKLEEAIEVYRRAIAAEPNNVELLRASDVLTVFLETPVEEMLTRCAVEDEPDRENPRPLAADAAAFHKLYEQRLPSYRAAHLTIDTSGKTIENIAREIAGILKLTSVR